jgi:hypothetical protein
LRATRRVDLDTQTDALDFKQRAPSSCRRRTRRI